MKGRRPTPPALQFLTGNPGKRAINRNEPKPKQDGVPPAPPHLDKIARVEWNRIAGDMYELGILTTLDVEVLATYCMLVSHKLKADRMIQKHGFTMIGSKGGIIQNPYVKIAHRAAGLIKQYAAEFGLTASSRGRIQLPAKEEEDELAKYF